MMTAIMARIRFLLPCWRFEEEDALRLLVPDEDLLVLVFLAAGFLALVFLVDDFLVLVFLRELLATVPSLGHRIKI